MKEKSARQIMGDSFTGREELVGLKCVLDFQLPKALPEIPFSEEALRVVRDTHVLVWCPDRFSDGSPVSIRTLREKLSEREEPCFYNQDWYLHELFFERPLWGHWALLPRNISEDSRGLEPGEICARYSLHSAVELTEVFMIRYLVSGGEKLWEHDYVWCEDEDNKGDQIYVGRYTDASGLNADGFEIHRHLKIKPNYGAF